MVEKAKVEEVGKAAAKRLTHAIKRGNELGSAIQDWIAKKPMGLEPSIADDRMSWKLVLKMAPEPELDEWTLIFGDTLHNLRSALNNLVTKIAAEEGATPAQLKGVQFPIANTEAEWNNQKRWVALLPIEVQAMIAQLQPFQRPKSGSSPATTDPLAILSALSNQDKHRIELTSTMNPQELAHEFNVEFYEIPEASVVNRIELDGRWESGTTVVKQDTSPYKIKNLQGTVNWVGQIAVTSDSGETYAPGELLGGLIPYVQQIMDLVLDAWHGRSVDQQ